MFMVLPKLSFSQPVSLLITYQKEINMSSKARKTKKIRNRKKSPNKTNLKTYMKRIQQNTAILKDLASKDEA